ncbi:hypothetical protein DEO72_LG7g1268 [Vigna unguiculata]|uniref:Uncharacterized protein n=1 Tax=Vigna unguiculata TaxID=3917 RepID=A0A4D6MHG2_VIGUN|nr:hypothetical protein DEO72_LG7g1268 [Vigna unguiculata]
MYRAHDHRQSQTDRVICYYTYQPQPIEHVRETIATDQTPQRQVEFPNTNIVRNVQDYQTCQLTTEDGNLSRPIHTGHNPSSTQGCCQLPNCLASDEYSQALSASEVTHAADPVWQVYSYRQVQVFQSPLTRYTSNLRQYEISKLLNRWLPKLEPIIYIVFIPIDGAWWRHEAHMEEWKASL